MNVIWKTCRFNVEKFPIVFDELWKAVGYSSKGNAKVPLVKNFKETIDYIVVIDTVTGLNISVDNASNSSSQLNQPYNENIYLTLNAAQEFALQADIDGGKKVRKFFIRCLRRYCFEK